MEMNELSGFTGHRHGRIVNTESVHGTELHLHSACEPLHMYIFEGGWPRGHSYETYQ